MLYLLAGLFDWVQFSTDRIKNPLVITGLVIIVLGIISLIVANPINNIKSIQEWEQKHNKSDVYIGGALKILGYVLIVVGCIMAAVVK